MRRLFPIGFAALIVLAACGTSTPTSTLQPLTVQYSFAATAWLQTVYRCAGDTLIRADPRAADYQSFDASDMALRLGQPANPAYPTYQIGTEDILVVVNRQNPTGALTVDQVRGLFTGQILTWKSLTGSDTQVQVWVFPAGEDVEQLFEQAALGGTPVTSAARLANTPDEMSQAIAGDVNAIGLLPRHWKAGNLSDVFTAASVPVLAVFPSKPAGSLANLLACLQK